MSKFISFQINSQKDPDENMNIIVNLGLNSELQFFDLPNTDMCSTITNSKVLIFAFSVCNSFHVLQKGNISNLKLSL